MEVNSHPRGREVLHYQPEELKEAGEGVEAEAGDVTLHPGGILLPLKQPTVVKHQIPPAEEKMEHITVPIKRDLENVMCVAATLTESMP